jgi:DNA-binding Lrp family transcriptional regulator
MSYGDIDDKDVRILEILQENAKISFKEICARANIAII